MNPKQVRQAVLDALGDIAPEADLTTLDPAVPFREQLDIDSVDLVNFVVGLEKRLGVAVPESEYARIATLDQCVEYLTPRVPA